jgi:uncharacterized protein YidB (DUF937 family)
MSGSEIAVQAFRVLSPVLLAAVTWVAAKLAQFINARVQNEYLRGVLVRLDDAVLSVVREVNQVTVDAIKSASIDGRLPAGTRESIKAAAINAVKSHLGAKGLSELARVLGLDNGAVDRLLSTRIEAAVHDIKAQQKKVTNGVNHTAIPGDIAPFPG